ncbi:tetratricopeptide repeat protein [bacterium]|nr:MAG: tetratricopeptide repeat protein [bacterium]
MPLKRKGNFFVLRTVTGFSVLLLTLTFFLSTPALAVEVSELTVDFPLVDVLDIPQGEEAENSEGGQARVPPPGFRAPWEDDWFAFRQNALRGNLVEAEKYLDRIENYRIDSGIPNLYIPAAALLFEASRAKEQSRYKDAYELIEYAIRLAPDDPASNFQMARTKWHQNQFRALASLDAVLEGLGKFTRDFRSILPWALGLVLWIFSSLLAASVITILLFALRVFPRIAHDLAHLTKMPQWAWYIIVPAVLGILLLTGLAFTLWIMLIALLMVAHLSSRERVAVALAVFLLISLPLLIHILALSDAFYGGTTGLTVYKAEMGGEGMRTIEELHKLRINNPDDPRILSALAIVLKRGQRGKEAEGLLRQAIDINPEYAPILNNLANIMLGSGRSEQAIEYYRRALRFSDDARIHYNLSQALRESLQLDEGEREFLLAQEIDPDLTGSLSAVRREGQQRVTIDIFGSMKEYLAGALKLNPDGKQWREILWSGFIPKVPFGLSWFVFPGASFFILLTWPLGAKLATASRCRQCNQLHCPKCTESSMEELCSQCRHIFVVRTGVDPASRVKKMMQIMRFKRKRGLVARGSTVLLPGMGHVLLGTGWPALVMIAITMGFWAKWVLWYGLFRNTTMLQIQTGSTGRIIFVSIFIIYYAIALLSIGRRLEER